MRLKWFLIIYFFIAGIIRSYAQDSVYVDFLINRISEQQVKTDNFFLPGTFKSYISNKLKFSTKQKDNNIFFNGLISYTLQSLQPYLSKENQSKIVSIDSSTAALSAKFKNQKGRNTYNFWRTDSFYKFPYTQWITLLRGDVTLPDDMDDTVLALLAQNAPDSVAEAVHQLMQQYIKKEGEKVKTAYKSYRPYTAYSTWFGKNFPVVFDVSVLCNVLSFVQHYNLPWAAADSASLNMIVHNITSGDYVNHPEFTSPYYGKTSIILYHLARLMSIKPIAELEALKPELISTANAQMKHSQNLLEKIILNSALIKWGSAPVDLGLPSTSEVQQLIEHNNLCFFIGNIPSYFPQPFKEWLISRKILLFYHFCPAYNDALLLEYIVLKNNLSPNADK